MWHTEIRIKNEQAEAAERKAKYTPNIGTSAKLKTEQDETERTNEGKKMKQQTRWSSTKRWKMKTKIAPCLWTQLPVCCFYDDCRWSNIEHAQHLPKKSANVCIYWKIYPLPFISDKCILFMLPFFHSHTHTQTYGCPLNGCFIKYDEYGLFFISCCSSHPLYARCFFVEPEYHTFILMNLFHFWWRSLLSF